ncbi:MAG: DUF4038 domain-containing protein [Alloacidobacterium sp.]
MKFVILLFLGACAFGQVVYPLKESTNHRYLVDQNNQPFLLVGDSPQSLIGVLSEASATAYFADRSAHGFNAVWINLLCDSYTFCNANGTTFDGIQPFTSGTGPSNYDLSTPSPAYFSRIDDMVNLAGESGLTVFLDPIETGGWLQTLEANGATKAFNYGAFLGTRYKSFPNIVWLSGNDFQDWSTSSLDNNLVKQVMAGIASTDSAHLQTIELDYLRSYSSQDTTLTSLLNLNQVYTYYDTYDYVLAAYNASPALPVFLGEANYEGENLGGTDGGSVGNLRKQEYWTLLCGATGQLYGNFQTDRTDWTSLSQIDSTGVTQLGYVTSLFRSIAWWNLVPDQTHQIITSGYGTYRGSATDLHNSTYATTAWITNGSVSITFTPVSTTLTVNLSKFNGPIVARWMDPTNGVFTTVIGSPFPNAGRMNLVTPGNNNEGSSDWVLVLTTQTLAPPTNLTATPN